jgi:hypothetical protein
MTRRTEILEYWQSKRQASSSYQKLLDSLPHDFRQFNEVIGLPIFPTSDPNAPPKVGQLASYQLTIGTYRGRDAQVLKSEKIGITEAILRWIIWMVTKGDCRGFQIMLGAQELKLAKENLRRLTDIFQNSEILRQLIAGEPAKETMYLKDGTTFFVMPRFAGAFQGWPRVKIAFLDDCAHYGLLDDVNIVNSAMTRLTNTRGYLRTASRPNGPRGFFYERHLKAQQPGSSIKEFVYPYELGVEAGLIDMEFIEEMKEQLGPWFSQHYECQFIGSKFAAMPSQLVDAQTMDGLEGRGYYEATEY